LNMAKKGQREPADRSRERKTVPFNIRVAPAEKEAFGRAAEIAGVPLSSWVRERLRRIAIGELRQAGDPIPFQR
jgi:hypothetical protein